MSSRPSRARKTKSFVLDSDSESGSESEASFANSDSDSDSAAFEEDSSLRHKPSARTRAHTPSKTKSKTTTKTTTKPNAASKPSTSSVAKKRKSESVSLSAATPVQKRASTATATASTAPVSSNGGTGAMNGWKGAPVASEAAARRLVQQYVMAQNRPYSVIQVYDNLHHRAGKAVVQRALDELSSGSNKCLAFKDYGKARIYFPDQSLLQDDYSSDDLVRLDTEGSRLDDTLKGLQQREAALRTEARHLESQPPDDSLAGALAEEKARSEGLRARVAALAGTGAGMRAVTEQDRVKAAAAHKKYRTAWRERKSKVRDLIDMMADGMEKPVKFVTELIGIETDEECGVSLPPALS